MSKLIGEFDAPGADRLPSDDNAAFQKEFLDIPVTEGEAVVQPDGIADDRERETVTRELLLTQHRITLPQQLATTLRG